MKIFNQTLITLLALPLVGFGQLNCPPISSQKSTNEHFHVTFGVGGTLLYGDVGSPLTTGFAVVAKADYRVRNGLHLGIEGQAGHLSAVSSKLDPRFATNNYKAFSFNATIYPFQFQDEEHRYSKKPAWDRIFLRSVYVGVGLGMSMNSYKDMFRDPLNKYGAADLSNGPYTYEAYYNPATRETEAYIDEQDTKSILAPILNFGLATPLNKYSRVNRSKGYFSLVLNTQIAFAMNDDLDGYAPISNGETKGKNDAYNFTYVGMRYSF